jgi:lipid II:glycine glycyltransferase (peptidoglycan interpeptide bridge formation enzyme)
MRSFIDITESQKDDFNRIVSHPLQSYEWGEFRKKTGVKVIRRGLISEGRLIQGFTLTLHKVPKTKFYIGYLPKGDQPTEELINELRNIGKQENCIYIMLEPNVVADGKNGFSKYKLRNAAHPLFTKYTFVLDITKSEEELIKNMHPKTRYNIRVAEKHKVKVYEDSSKESFDQYLKLMNETTNRQQFYAHTPFYHKSLWEIVPKEFELNTLSYHIFKATYETPEGLDKILTSWVLFAFKDYLYYPYGASSREHRETMSNNLVAWEAIKFGKKIGLKYFDMWGALGPDPDKNDPWYGFHRFKEGYGAELVEFVGSFDLVINPAAYEVYKIADKLRWGFLKAQKMLFK